MLNQRLSKSYRIGDLLESENSEDDEVSLSCL